MSRFTIARQLFLLCMLAALVSSAFAASASASPELPFKSPTLFVCQEAPANYIGLYTEHECKTNTAKGSWAWATAANAAETWYCLLASSANQLYTEGLCQTHNTGAGAFLAVKIAKKPLNLIAAIDPSTLKGKVAGTETEITCSGGKATDAPETGSLSSGPILYTKCKAIKPSGCEISSTQLKKPGEIETEQLMSTLTSQTLLSFTPKSGKKFVELEFTGSGCSITSGTTAEVEGEQMCTFTTGWESPAMEHSFLCKASESKLELGKKAATYEGLNLLEVEDLLWWKIK